MKRETMMIVTGIGMAVLGLWFFSRKGYAQQVGETVGVAAGNAVVGTATGVVLGVGDAVGVPRTDMTECERALAEGRTWDASFACPAGTFIKSFFK